MPTDKVSSCVRGFATLCKLERTSLAVAGVVACFSSNKTKLTKLGGVLVPDFQSALRFFEQSLILATDRCIDGESLAHALLPSLRLVHFVRQQT
jgi:hypothetical protein